MSHLQRRTSRDWFLALRPWSFPASMMPVLLSLGYYAQAGRTIDIPNALIALVSVVLLHAAGNLWSDVFDFRTGVDAKDTEGVRVLAHGCFTIGEYLTLAAFLGALGVAGAVWLALRTDLELLWATAVGVAAAVFYPPLKYHAWGDAVIFFAYTLTPMFAMSRIVTGEWSAEALPALLPTGILTVAILHANNLRDIPTDRRAGIRTLASVLGESKSVALLKFEYVVPFLVVLGAMGTGHLPIFAFLPFLAVGAMMPLWRDVSSFSGRGVAAIARLDEGTAKAQLVFSVLMTAGLFLAAWLR